MLGQITSAILSVSAFSHSRATALTFSFATQCTFLLLTRCEVSHSRMMSFEERRRRRSGNLRALLSSTRLLPFGFRLATRSVRPSVRGRGCVREVESGDGRRTREVRGKCNGELKSLRKQSKEHKRDDPIYQLKSLQISFKQPSGVLTLVCFYEKLVVQLISCLIIFKSKITFNSTISRFCSYIDFMEAFKTSNFHDLLEFLLASQI